MTFQLRTFLAAIVLAVTALPAHFAAAESIHERIDLLIQQKNPQVQAAPAASDAEFLRRVWLDLNGTIPTSAEAKQFLADVDPAKREKLIDKLLARPEYARRMQEAFGAMLMERRARDGAPLEKWDTFLRESFAANKPLDQICREILNPDPVTGAALFYTKRLEHDGQVPIDYPGLARDVGRLFLGVDLKCAQCHDHKYIKDYKQADYQGLFAFVGTTYIRTDTPVPAVGEKPLTKKVDYVSVFRPKEPQQIGPRLPGGAEAAIPDLKEADQWAEPPDPKKNFPGVPKFSTLKVLAEQVPKSDNAAFKRNLANRLWFMMMGRGLVNPLDQHHAANPPSHPELLDYLADQVAAGKFDAKAFLREVALSQTYQRSSEMTDGQQNIPARETFLISDAKRMSSEQLMWSFLTASGNLEATLAADPKSPPEGVRPLPLVRKKFDSAFANPAGEPEIDFAPSVAAALFVSNDKLILEGLQPKAGNLVDRLSKLNDAKEIADELYLSILTRFPSDQERADVATYLTKRADKRADAMSELAWSLIASTEFAVNH